MCVLCVCVPHTADGICSVFAGLHFPLCQKRGQEGGTSSGEAWSASGETQKWGAWGAGGGTQQWGDVVQEQTQKWGDMGCRRGDWISVREEGE